MGIEEACDVGERFPAWFKVGLQVKPGWRWQDG